MIVFATLDVDGYPIGGGSLPALPAGAVALGDDYTTVDLPRLMYQSGVWQERPQLPSATTTPAGIRVDGLPATATVRVDRLGSDAHWEAAPVSGTVVLALPKDGTFQVTVAAPRPWMGCEATFVRGTGSAELVADALNRAKDAGVDRVNDAIGDIRLKYVTDIPGQQTIYTEKQDEAQAYLAANPAPATLADYPLLAAEVGVTAPTAYQLAQVWANKAQLFKQVAAITERLRMQSGGAIAAATTEAGVDAAVQTALTTLSHGPL